MHLELLKKIGLSSGEIKVYEALLSIGSSSTNKIHEKTGIERRNIYDILNKLIERGFVNYVVENKKKVFRATHPQSIFGYIEEKKIVLDQIEKEIAQEMPKIIDTFESKKTDVNAEVYRGSEGIKSVFEDMLNHQKLYWIGSGDYMAKKFPAFFTQWNQRRIESKVEMFHLFRNELKNKVPKRLLQHVKFLPREFSQNPVVVAVYGNKVATFLLGDLLFAFLIESKELADNYISYHQFLWNKIAKE